MNLPDLSIKRPVFMSMVLLTLVLFGLIAYRNLGIDLYPKVEFPMITVVSTLPSADPETMETVITDPIEEALSTIDSIKTVRSTSAEGISHVMIQFDLKKDIDIAYQEVQAKIGSLHMQLPRDIIGPVINKFNINEIPILSLIVSSDLPVGELSHVVDKQIKPQIKRIPNVGQINVAGGQDRKVWLWVDRDKLDAYQLTIEEVEGALKAQHIDLPAGRISQEGSEVILKTKGELPSPADFENVVITTKGGAPIRFSDVGRVEEGLEEARSASQLGGTAAISLSIGKQAGSNTVEVAKKVKQEAASLQKSLAAQGVRIEVAQDTSLHIENSVNEVRFHLFFGGALAILIVFLFLRNVRSTLVCALALPTAVIGTFAFMSYLGFTQNVMTLLALSIAIGLLIDDAIVVQENIIRHLEKGMNPMEASSIGTKQITLAVFATTLSVVAVFVPVAFMKGIVGRFFYQFGMTVSIAVLISMLVSFTLNPLFSSRFLKAPKRGRLYQRFEAAFESLENGYAKTLHLCLKYKKSVLGLAVFSFVGAIFLSSALRFEFSPQVDQGEFTVSIKTPEGSSLEHTHKVVNELEAQIQGHSWIHYIYSSIGSSHLKQANRASIYVKMQDKKHRTTSQRDAIARIRDKLTSTTDAEITVSAGEKGPEGGHAGEMQFEIRGPSLAKLQEISDSLIEKMKTSTGYVDIGSSFEEGTSLLSISINRAAAADLGVSAFQIATAVKASIGGTEVTTLRREGENRPVTLRLSDAFRKDVNQIPLLKVRNQQGKLIPLSNLIEIKKYTRLTSIERNNRMRQVTVHANLVRSQKVLGEATKEIQEFIQSAALPPEYQFHLGGEAEMMKESFGHMFFALSLAVILVYMVLAAQFESFVHPFIIMLSLPLSIIGAIGALVAFKMTMSIFTMIGIIMLMGLVTKNGILLVDLINSLQSDEKMSRFDAIVTAGKHRLRPILMTTLAVILGMLPVALGTGSGSESNAPMAVAVIGGLITSTLLTLLVVPVVYFLVESLREKKLLSRLFRKKSPKAVITND